MHSLLLAEENRVWQVQNKSRGWWTIWRVHERNKDKRERATGAQTEWNGAFILPLIWKSNLSTSRRTFTGCLVCLKTERGKQVNSSEPGSGKTIHFTDRCWLSLPSYSWPVLIKVEWCDNVLQIAIWWTHPCTCSKNKYYSRQFNFL